MIGVLRGKVVEYDSEVIVLDVGGVGYELHVPSSNLARVGTRPEDEHTFYTHLHVRDDALQLFGFGSREEKGMFERLLSISKVGPKVALGILSSFSSVSLRQAILDEDVLAISRAPGVGRKTAERIVLELKDKLPLGVEDASVAVDSAAGDGASLPAVKIQVREALMGLGYSFQEASAAVSGSEATDPEQMLREALKALGRT